VATVRAFSESALGLLRLVAQVAVRETRNAAAADLAAAIGADDLLIFVRDREVGALLAAPGFAQTLPNGKAWQAFLAATVTGGRYEGVLPLRRADAALPAIGYAAGRDVALVLVGARAQAQDPEWLIALLPAIASTLRSEQEAIAAAASVGLARDAAHRAATLAQTVDRTRRQLEEALLEAERARAELERANQLLHEQAVEQEMTNQQLQEQAAELEAQTTELEAQAEELHRARAAADKANLAKSEFLATMSHELRTPLNAIGGHVQLLSMGLHGPVTDAQRQSLERIDRSARHLLGIINDILNLSRIEAGRVEYVIGEVSLADALADVAPMIEPQLGAKALAYELPEAAGLGVVCADGEKLQQILLNLLSNAVKFTDTGGRVWIEAGQCGGAQPKGFVRVCDTGRGIPADKISAIFEPFMQVDASHSRMGQGTGLGLAISRDLARGMGGDLTAESQVGRGSAFTLTLPRPVQRTAP
jgi:signal transduction histidine kinase